MLQQISNFKETSFFLNEWDSLEKIEKYMLRNPSWITEMFFCKSVIINYFCNAPIAFLQNYIIESTTEKNKVYEPEFIQQTLCLMFDNGLTLNDNLVFNLVSGREAFVETLSTKQFGIFLFTDELLKLKFEPIFDHLLKKDPEQIFSFFSDKTIHPIQYSDDIFSERRKNRYEQIKNIYTVLAEEEILYKYKNNSVLSKKKVHIL